MSKKHILNRVFSLKKAMPAFNVSSIDLLRAIFEISKKYNYPVFIETSK